MRVRPGLRFRAPGIVPGMLNFPLAPQTWLWLARDGLKHGHVIADRYPDLGDREPVRRPGRQPGRGPLSVCYDRWQADEGIA